jgi:hypothetical protein
MKMSKSILSLVLVAMIATIMSCSKSDPTPAALTATTISDFSADPPTGRDPNTGVPTGLTGKYSLFSFSTGAKVANTDSATTKWDIGFNSTNIIINGGTSGPGTASAQLYSGIFTDLTTAPDAGYLQDNKVTPAYAIPRTSGNTWYTYNSTTNIITPTAGRFIVIKTSSGNYAKVEILNYYQGAPLTPTSSSVARYYTFRYIYQPTSGSKSLQ